MAKKKEEIGGDIFNADELDADLDDVAIKAVARGGGGGGVKKIIPKEFANALKTKFDKESELSSDNDGTFAVPKEWLEKKMGLNTASVMGGKPYGIKKRLNQQHGDIVGEGKLWHVGSFTDPESGDDFYLISISEVNTDEEQKWKNPPKKDKKEKEE